MDDRRIVQRIEGRFTYSKRGRIDVYESEAELVLHPRAHVEFVTSLDATFLVCRNERWMDAFLMDYSNTYLRLANGVTRLEDIALPEKET